MNDVINILFSFKLIKSQEKVTDFKEMAKLFKINATGMEDSGN